MIVRVTESEAAHLVEPEILNSLAVRLVGDAPHDLGEFGSIEGDHAWLGVKALKTAAHAIGVPEGWDDQFEGMLAYAKEQGWLSSSGSAVRAHIERH